MKKTVLGKIIIAVAAIALGSASVATDALARGGGGGGGHGGGFGGGQVVLAVAPGSRAGHLAFAPAVGLRMTQSLSKCEARRSAALPVRHAKVRGYATRAIVTTAVAALVMFAAGGGDVGLAQIGP